MEKEIYIALKQEIESNLPKLKKVALFNNQFENESVENPFEYPCCFLQFSPVNFKDLTMGVQQVEITLTTHLGFESYKDEDVDVLDLKQELYKVVQRFQYLNGNMSMFTRIAERPNYDHNNIQVYETDYKFTVKDFTADIRPTKTVTATPVITATVVNIDEL